MMTKERKELLQKQITDVLDKEGFIEGLAKAASAEDVCRLLSDFDIQAIPREVEELTNDGNEALKRYAENTGDELSEADLALVSGGGKFWRFLGAAVGGIITGAALGFVCGLNPALTPVAYKIAAGYSVGAGIWVSRG